MLSNWASQFGLNCKANKGIDAGTGDLGVLPAHATGFKCLVSSHRFVEPEVPPSAMIDDAGSTHPG